MPDSLIPIPGRILIADDSSSVRTIIKKLLESHSTHWRVCAEAANGMETVQKALVSKPNLIIMDFQMPFMDGLNASARIAKFLPHVPILIYTVHKSEYINSEAKKAGVREVISKSEPGALLRAVEALLSKHPNPGRPDENEVGS
jgi:DNA-binding NarL/FixJ family response regulator